MRFIELTVGNILKLPDEIARFFNPPEKFVVIADSDGLVLKRVAKPTLSELAEQVPDSNPPSLWTKFSVEFLKNKGLRRLTD